MKLDYIIIGSGLAGISFCEELIANNKTFIVFDNNSQQSSMVAGGLYNPVILKRFSSVWKSKEQLQLALPIWAGIENRLSVKLDYKLPVYRRFNSIQEQNDWYTASDKPNLSPYLFNTIHPNSNEYIDAPFGFGEVLDTGRIDTKLLVEKYKLFLKDNDRLVEAAFDYSSLKMESDAVHYKSISATQIIFAEGFGMLHNPFFNTLPLNEVKGELITIRAPDLKIDFVLKSNVFIIPLGNDLYKIGATYDWKDKSNSITQKAKDELLNKVKQVLSCEFSVVDQVAGIRPTVRDRRPLIGAHKTHKRLYILNGLGTRGVMIGPYVANALFNHIENNTPLDSEMDIKRFDL